MRLSSKVSFINKVVCLPSKITAGYKDKVCMFFKLNHGSDVQSDTSKNAVQFEMQFGFCSNFVFTKLIAFDMNSMMMASKIISPDIVRTMGNAVGKAGDVVGKAVGIAGGAVGKAAEFWPRIKRCFYWYNIIFMIYALFPAGGAGLFGAAAAAIGPSAAMIRGAQSAIRSILDFAKKIFNRFKLLLNRIIPGCFSEEEDTASVEVPPVTPDGRESRNRRGVREWEQGNKAGQNILKSEAFQKRLANIKAMNRKRFEEDERGAQTTTSDRGSDGVLQSFNRDLLEAYDPIGSMSPRKSRNPDPTVTEFHGAVTNTEYQQPLLALLKRHGVGFWDFATQFRDARMQDILDLLSNPCKGNVGHWLHAVGLNVVLQMINNLGMLCVEFAVEGATQLGDAMSKKMQEFAQKMPEGINAYLKKLAEKRNSEASGEDVTGQDTLIKIGVKYSYTTTLPSIIDYFTPKDFDRTVINGGPEWLVYVVYDTLSGTSRVELGDNKYLQEMSNKFDNMMKKTTNMLCYFGFCADASSEKLCQTPSPTSCESCKAAVFRTATIYVEKDEAQEEGDQTKYGDD
eukprot:g4951.t1